MLQPAKQTQNATKLFFLDWLSRRIVVFSPSMKNLHLTILTAALLAAMSFSAAAQSKLASVDMKKVFSNYWKTKQADAALENRFNELRKELKDMGDSLEKAQTDYKALLDQANDTAISPDERDKRKLAATAKAKEISTSKTTLDQFQRQAEAQLADEKQRMNGNLVTDIKNAVADKAKAGGYTVVLNSNNSDVLTVLYCDPKIDITDAVLAQLNAGAPIDLTRPVGSAASNVSTNLP